MIPSNTGGVIYISWRDVTVLLADNCNPNLFIFFLRLSHIYFVFERVERSIREFSSIHINVFKLLKLVLA